MWVIAHYAIVVVMTLGFDSVDGLTFLLARIFIKGLVKYAHKIFNDYIF